MSGNTQLVVFNAATTHGGRRGCHRLGKRHQPRSITLGNTAATALAVGMAVTGPNIPVGTTIASVTNTTTNTVVDLEQPGR